MLNMFSSCFTGYDSQTVSYNQEKEEPLSASQLLKRLKAAHSNEQRMALIDNFFAAHSPEDFPIVEDTTCYFFFRGKGAQAVVGDFNQWNPQADPFISVSNTDLFYVVKHFPLNARLDYKLIVDGKWILDPFNSRTVWGGFGPNSELMMPQYQFPSEIKPRAGIQQGKVIAWSFRSAVLNNTRQIWVYLPWTYARYPRKRFPVLYVQDGGEYIRLANMITILNKLIAQQRIEPIITVFINPVDRQNEYWFNPDYVKMLKEELIPAVDSTWRTLSHPQHRGIMGASLGGTMSFFIALNHQLFAKVASQSGALGIANKRIFSLFQQTRIPPLTIYLDWGMFEKGQREVHQKFQKLLEQQGHTVFVKEHPEGHSWGNWRAHIDDILITFWGK